RCDQLRLRGLAGDLLGAEALDRELQAEFPDPADRRAQWRLFEHAAALRALGRPAEALAELDRLDLALAGDTTRRERAEAAILRAQLQRALGRLDLADPLVRGALDELQAMLPADAPQIAAALLELGELHLAREQYADADDPLTRAATIFAKHAEPDHPPLARARFALARARTGAVTTTAPANRALAESAAAGFQAPAAASEAAALTRWLAEHPPA
ncbi:MAG: tetratricopeptide repeat protein, partial [Myxococcales bacterium]|nr:tetratricopeptide repeat protein [Myxococcales bacterium]